MEPRTLHAPLVNAAAFAILLWALNASREFFIPVALAALLAFALAPVVRLAKRLRLPEWAAILTAVLVVLVPLGLVVYFVASEIEALVRDWPHVQSSLSSSLRELRGAPWVQKLHLEGAVGSSGEEGGTGSSALKIAGGVLGGMAIVVSAGTRLVLVCAFAIMMLAARIQLYRATKLIVMEFRGPAAAEVVDRASTMMEDFLTARVGIMVVTGLAGWAAMLAFGVPYSLALATLFGVMTWVPVIGMILALLAPAALTIAGGATAAHVLALLATLIVIWAIQDHVLTPKWLGSRIKLNFLSTYLALFAGGLLWGPWGMILSVPLLGVLRIAFERSEEFRSVSYLFSEKMPPDPDERVA